MSIQSIEMYSGKDPKTVTFEIDGGYVELVIDDVTTTLATRDLLRVLKLVQHLTGENE